MLVLHHAWRSSASRRVRMFLEEKGLAYESHPVDLAKMEHHTPEYLKINPNGVIPALVHDGRALHESGTICEYIDDAFDGPPLRPEGAYERATMRNWIRHADERIGNLIIFNWVHSLAKSASQWSDAELAGRMETTLRDTAWLAGERYSIADIALAPFVKRIEEEIAPDALTAEKHPRVTGWWKAIQARPTFARANFGPFVDA